MAREGAPAFMHMHIAGENSIVELTKDIICAAG